METNNIIQELIGATIESIEGLEQYSDELVIRTSKGKARFYHAQDCCEIVSIEDFELDSDLTGAVLLSAEEVIGENEIGEYDESDCSSTWTFYKFETSKGGLFVRWLGQSNGYYSESVDYEVLLKKRLI